MKLSHISLTILALALLAGCGNSSDNRKDGFNFGQEDTTSADVKAQDVDTGITCKTSYDCPAEAPICDQMNQVCVECTTNTQCAAPTPFCHPLMKSCVSCVMDDDCGSESLHCLDGTCTDKVCWPGVASCIGNSVHTCSEDGSDPNWKVNECLDKICHNGECLVCTPKKTQCKDNQVVKCSDDGQTFEVEQDCGMNECIGAVCLFCYPGNKKCEDNVSMICNESGNAWEVNQDCATAGLNCVNGACYSPCSGDVKQNTNAGCEFFAVDLHNALESDGSTTYDAQNAQFAVVASNTSESSTATVTVTKPDGQTVVNEVPARSLQKFLLPSKWGLSGTELGNKSFKITSTQPITVYQFNPLSNEDVFSNDASVLLPSPTVGNEYYVATLGSTGNFQSYFVIVGVGTVPQQVSFTVTAPTKAGTGIPALAKGDTHTVTVSQGQVAAVEASSGDLTGTRVWSDDKFALFAGHTAAVTADRCCADHLEQQLAPVSTWGNHYLVGKSQPRMAEKDHIRIIAAKDGTMVTLNPATSIIPTLNAGDFYAFSTDKSVEITSPDPSKPIMVVQYLASSYEITGAKEADGYCNNSSGCPAGYACDYGQCSPPSCSGSGSGCPSGHSCEESFYGNYCAPIGDPAMMLAVPEEQFLKSYVFLTPDAYLEDYLNVIAPATAQTVVLDGNQINPTSFTAIGMSGYGLYRTKVSDGVHEIWADQPIGIMVYGYDDDVSYGYPGGLGLSNLSK